MKIEKTNIDGVFIVDLDIIKDERGEFARIFCENEFISSGIDVNFVQANISNNFHKGTLRGMHYQSGSDSEAKFVRCTNGSIYDVALDMRLDSPTYLKWFGVELSRENQKGLFIPRGCAHGYQTLEEDSTVLYFVDNFYAPQSELGVKYDDPLINIKWPLTAKNISKKDMALAYLNTEKR